MTADYAQTFMRMLLPVLDQNAGQRMRRYAFGLSAGVAGAVVVFVIEWLSEDIVFTPGIVAVLIAAWFGGLGPGLLALVLVVAAVPLFLAVSDLSMHSAADYVTHAVIAGPFGVLTAVLGHHGRRAMHSLRRSEQLFDSFMGNLPGAAWMKDIDGRYVYANEEAVRVLNTPRRDLYGRTDLDLFPAATAQQFMENDHLAHSRRESLQAVEALERDDGLHHALVVKFPVTENRDGDPTYVGGVAIDITAHRQAEQELEARSDQLQLVIDTVPALVSFVDREGRYVFNSQMYEEWFGMDAAEIRGQTMEAVFGPDAYSSIRPYVERALAGEVVEYETVLPEANGASRWIEAKYVPHRDRTGAVDGFFSLVLDVTARKNLEMARTLLTRVTGQLGRSLDVDDTVRGLLSAVVPSFVDHAAVYFAGPGDTIRGIEAAKGAALPPQVGTYEIDRDAPRGVAAVLRSGRAEHYRRAPLDLAFPARVHPPVDEAAPAGRTSVMFAPIVAHNEVVAVLAVATDDPGRTCEEHDFNVLKEIARRAGLAIQQSLMYEESRRVTEELRIANSAKDEFLGTVSHELRTPITIILGNASLLANRHQQMDADTVSASLADLLGQAERLHRVVENMLILSRLERGAGAEAEPILIARSISQVIAEAQRQQPGRVIRLESHDWDLFALGAESYVHQVLLNYVNNAMRYSDLDEPIDLSVQLVDGEVCVRVLDRGIGLTVEELDNLFTPFFRSERVPDNARGMGIGLSVSQRLIEALGGRVWGRPREGGGAEFGFSLPAVAGREVGEVELHPEPGASAGAVLDGSIGAERLEEHTE